MVTPQELKMMCGESNEISGEKTVLCSTTEKKNCLLLIKSEKNCTVKGILSQNKKMVNVSFIAMFSVRQLTYPNITFTHYLED